MQVGPPTVHLADILDRPQWLNALEARRNRLKCAPFLMELWAEMVGCFIYSFLSIACGLAQLNAITNNNPTLASGPLQVGLSVAFGIIFCVSTSGTVSAGHFNPSITIAFSLFRRFPKWKVPFYIVSQILGGYLACAGVYFPFRYVFLQIEDVMRQRGVLEELQFTTQGPSGVFAFYVPLGQTMWGAWLSEFLASLTAYTTFWAVMDPSNTLVTPRMSTWVGAFAVGVSIFSFSSILNASRDMGGRLWALTIWGRGASGGSYAAVSSLTGTAGMLVAAFLYELFMLDSRRVVNLESLEHVRLLTNKRDYIDEKSKNSSVSSLIGIAQTGRSTKRNSHTITLAGVVDKAQEIV